MAARLRLVNGPRCAARTPVGALALRAVRAAGICVGTVVGAGWLPAACVEAPVGLDIALYPDPNLNTLDQVLAQTRSLEVVLDAAGGLYFPGEEMDDGTIAIRDDDGDPSDLELVARVPTPASRLPSIRLVRGGLPDVPIDVSVRGYADVDGTGALVAEGSLPVVFGPGHAEVAVPFNLMAARRPPRVDRVVASYEAGCDAPLLSVVFSRPVAAASVLGPGVFTFEPGGAPRSVVIDSVNGEGSVALVRPPDAVVGATGVSFRLTVATSVVDVNGVVLDQVLPIPGNQAYVGRYEEVCGM